MTIAATWLPEDPHQILGIGSVGQNSTFSEHGDVAYEIKENQECSNMVEKYFVRRPPPPPILGMGSVGQN